MNSRIRIISTLWLSLFILFGACFSQRVFAVDYEIRDLGNLGGSPEGVRAKPYGINDSAQVVGSSTYNFNTNSYAFLWENGVMRDLGNLGASGYSYAHDINNNGQVVGSSTYPEGGGGYDGFLWENGSMTRLIGSGHWGSAKGINSSAQVVGHSMAYNRLNCDGHLWENGTRTNLGSLGGNFTYAEGINDSGQVVGYSQTSQGEFHAFIWENGAMRDIAGSNSSAYDINNSGQIVGRLGYAAFMWQNGTIILLGGDNSGAYAINEFGEVVGWSNGRAVLWEDGTMIDLNNLFPSGSGWELIEATAINNNGQIIGSGYYGGELRGFIISPANVVPEPSSILLFISGLFGYLWISGFKKNKN